MPHRPTQNLGRPKGNRHVLTRQPQGYYRQVIPDQHMHSHARGMKALKEGLRH